MGVLEDSYNVENICIFCSAIEFQHPEHNIAAWKVAIAGLTIKDQHGICLNLQQGGHRKAASSPSAGKNKPEFMQLEWDTYKSYHVWGERRNLENRCYRPTLLVFWCQAVALIWHLIHHSGSFIYRHTPKFTEADMNGELSLSKYHQTRRFRWLSHTQDFHIINLFRLDFFQHPDLPFTPVHHMVINKWIL